MQGNRRDKPIIEFDPEIEKTLKKNRSRVKAQRALQFDQEEGNSEEGASEKSFEEELAEENTEEEIQDNMADNANNQRRTLADYTNPTTTSCERNRRVNRADRRVAIQLRVSVDMPEVGSLQFGIRAVRPYRAWGWTDYASLHTLLMREIMLIRYLCDISCMIDSDGCEQT
ncbi:hypothetical protein PIB30_057738 [Stylosanthes scabra]|uniref:Uncharacterized protein n=1 Tax=Stylosanthes scabra TaxID=79078 RepID=A0ABU6TKC4_9FABA|nr:hypothetical protein [Stylosanthes scabra]